MPVTISGDGGIAGISSLGGGDFVAGSLTSSGDLIAGPQAVDRATLFVDDSDNSVSINTTVTPAAGVFLQVADATDPVVSLNNTGNGEVRLGCTAAGGYIGTESNHPFNIEANSATAVTVIANGYVGIGTGSPTRRLVVQGDLNTVLAIKGQTAGTSSLFLGSTATENIGALTYNHPSNRLEFTVNSAEAARFDSSRRFGIGVGNTAMTTLFEVHGDNGSGGLVKIRDTSAYAEDTGPAISLQGEDSGTTIRQLASISARSTSTANTGELVFITRQAGGLNNEAARFNRFGNLAFPNGQGIDFSASEGASATSSILDDYEEGSFTPVIKDTNGSGGNIAPSTGAGHYIKIGSMCYVSCRINNIDTSGLDNTTMFVHGMPFVSASDGYGIGAVLMAYINFNGQVDVRWLNSRTYAYFDDMVSGQLFTNLTRDDFTTTSSRIEFNVITQCN